MKVENDDRCEIPLMPMIKNFKHMLDLRLDIRSAVLESKEGWCALTFLKAFRAVSTISKRQAS